MDEEESSDESMSDETISDESDYKVSSNENMIDESQEQRHRLMVISKNQSQDQIKDAVSQYGHHVKILKLKAKCYPAVINEFPAVEKLILIKLSNIKYFEPFPTTLQEIKVVKLKQHEPLDVIYKLQLMPNLKAIQTNRAKVTEDYELCRMSLGIPLFSYTSTLRTLISTYPKLFREIGINQNVWPLGTVLEPTHITAIYGYLNFRDFPWLAHFPNLEVSSCFS